jgi:hypothetical protein
MNIVFDVPLNKKLEQLWLVLLFLFPELLVTMN